MKKLKTIVESFFIPVSVAVLLILVRGILKLELLTLNDFVSIITMPLSAGFLVDTIVIFILRKYTKRR